MAMRERRAGGLVGVSSVLRVVGVLVLAALFVACSSSDWSPMPGPPTPGTPPPTAADPGWDAFSGGRTDALVSLAAPAKECVQRHDTSHAAFHGCIDWHSAVHATYALLAVSRITGDPTYRQVALSAAGDPVALAAERDDIRGGTLEQELPYGFAWMLVLDTEAGRDGIDAFHTIGSAVRDRLVEYLRAEQTDPNLEAAVTSSDYGSAVWADYALALWSARYRDEQAGALARAVATRIIGNGTVAELCTPSAFEADVEFFSPCHLLYLLSAQTGVVDASLAQHLDVLAATPTTAQPLPSDHSAGLNFSRAWGLYAAWRTYHDPRLRNTWAKLVVATLNRSDEWRTGYSRYAHWVAQFGIFAIAATFDE